jgi:hypothetical protein
MEHKILADDQTFRPSWMIKKGLFYCLCPKCGNQITQVAGKIRDDINEWFYYSTEPCKDCN